MEVTHRSTHDYLTAKIGWIFQHRPDVCEIATQIVLKGYRGGRAMGCEISLWILAPEKETFEAGIRASECDPFELFNAHIGNDLIPD